MIFTAEVGQLHHPLVGQTAAHRRDYADSAQGDRGEVGIATSRSRRDRTRQFFSARSDGGACDAGIRRRAAIGPMAAVVGRPKWLSREDMPLRLLAVSGQLVTR